VQHKSPHSVATLFAIPVSPADITSSLSGYRLLTRYLVPRKLGVDPVHPHDTAIRVNGHLPVFYSISRPSG
jgi:hypothetical protein